MIKLTEREILHIWNLCSCWEELSVGAFSGEGFDYESFKIIAIDTFSLLEKFFIPNSLPVPIVRLLQAMAVFSENPFIASKEHEAAQIVVETLSNPDECFGINGVDYERNPNGERTFSVDFWDNNADDDCKFKIDTSTFDLSEIIKKID